MCTFINQPGIILENIVNLVLYRNWLLDLLRLNYVFNTLKKKEDLLFADIFCFSKFLIGAFFLIVIVLYFKRDIDDVTYLY